MDMVITVNKDENGNPVISLGYLLNTLGAHIFQGNKERGFWPLVPTERNVGELIALIHSELSEGLEAHRKDLMDDKLTHRKGLEVELADALIRILDMGAGLGMDIGGALMEKLDYNSKREYKHGKNY